MKDILDQEEVLMPLPRPIVLPFPLVQLTQAAVLSIAPHGGQRAARRNAWLGTVAEAACARARREADDAMRAAVEDPCATR